VNRVDRLFDPQALDHVKDELGLLRTGALKAGFGAELSNWCYC
jgi:hypothetical protein